MVEDTENNHPLFREAFGTAGFEVLISQTAEPGFEEVVGNLKPDIISMDLMIGKEGEVIERDGLKALEALKADERTKDIPVIVMTNFFEDSKIEKAKSLGAVDFISLQAHNIKTIPQIFLSYLENPKKYFAIHPTFRNTQNTSN